MKKAMRIFTFITLTFILVACGNSIPKADYSESKAEKILNDGGEIKGKTVSIKVAKLEPKSAFGYNIKAGQHLNFVSEENPDVKAGDNLIVKVKKVKSILGSFVINYDLIHKTAGKKVTTVKKSSSSKSKNSSSVKPDPNANKRTWTYKDDVFDAGIETYKFTKAEIRDTDQPGKKAILLYCDITNNSTSKPDPSLVTMVMKASQKTDTSEKELSTAVVLSTDSDSDNPLKKYEDALTDKLLPGKTTHAVIVYGLVNDSDVRIDFENADFNTIGSKTYNLKKLKYVKSKSSNVLDSDTSASSTSQTAVSTKANSANYSSSKVSTSSSESKDTDMVSVGAGKYSQYNDPHSQTDTPKEEHALEEYMNSLNNQ